MSQKEKREAIPYEKDAKGNVVKNGNGLRTRRTVAPKPVKLRKPNKMNTVKPRVYGKDRGTSVANSALLVFPTDKTGITGPLKQAMKRIAGKIGKDKERLALVDETLRILVEHVHARFEHNCNAKPLKSKVAEDVNVSYKDQRAALKEEGVKPKSLKAEDVLEAYNALQERKANQLELDLGEE